MLSKHIATCSLLAVTVLAACKKNNNPEQPAHTSELVVLGYTQNPASEYDRHYLWSKNETTTFGKLNLYVSRSVEFGSVNNTDIYLAQQGSYWKNNTKTELFPPGETTANVTFRFYQNSIVTLIRKPSATQSAFFDYSIMEDSNTLFTVNSTTANIYEFKDFVESGDTYYLLGYDNSLNIHPLIYVKKGQTTSSIDLSIAGKNFQPAKFELYGSKFYITGYVNRNGVLHAAIMTVNTDGSDKAVSELNIAQNSVLSNHLLVDGTDIYVTGWEPDGSGAYYAFYVKNNQKHSLSNKQSRAMQIIKVNNDVYIAGLEWGPNLMYKLWKNAEFYADIKTADNKPIIPLQLLFK